MGHCSGSRNRKTSVLFARPKWRNWLARPRDGARKLALRIRTRKIDSTAIQESSKNNTLQQTHQDDVPFSVSVAKNLTEKAPEWALLDSTEEKNLAALRGLLIDEIAKLKRNNVTLNNGTCVSVLKAFPDVYGDLRVLRFLRKDKVPNLSSALARYRSFLSWRQHRQIDNIRAKVEEIDQPDSPGADLVADCTPFSFSFSSESVRTPEDTTGDNGRFGTADITVHLGKWKTSVLAGHIRNNDLTLDDFLHYWAFLMEGLHRNLYQESLRRERMIYVRIILDLDGTSLRQFSAGFVASILPQFIELIQSNYPETTKRISVLNAPRTLNIAWKLVTPLVSAGTVEKVTIVPGQRGAE